MKLITRRKTVITGLFFAIALYFQLFAVNVYAASSNTISLTVAGTTDTTTSIFADDPLVLDLFSTLNSSISTPIFTVNIPQYVKISKYTLPADSNGKVQKVELIDKGTGAVLSSDDSTKNRILKFTITPGTIGPTGLDVEVTPDMRYTLPAENFTLTAQIFNGANMLNSQNFTISATNYKYEINVVRGEGDVMQNRIARYEIGVYSGSDYGNPVYMKNALVTVPLPTGASYVVGSGGSDVQYVASAHGNPAYLSVKNWDTQISWAQFKSFMIEYPSATVGKTFTGTPITLTYTHGGRTAQTITQPDGISNHIIASPGAYSTQHSRSYQYKIGYSGSPFLTFCFFNDNSQALTNLSYDITLPSELKVLGLNAIQTNLSKTVYANLTFTTNTNRTITYKVKTSDINLTPSVLNLTSNEWITKVNVLMPSVPVGFALADFSSEWDGYHIGFVLYGKTADNVLDGTTATMKIYEHSTQKPQTVENDVDAMLCENAQSDTWCETDGEQSVIAGQKFTTTNYVSSSNEPYDDYAYYEVVNPTVYFIIPTGFTVDTGNVVFGDEFTNKTPNISWFPGIIPSASSNPDFKNGAGVLKIEFDGSTPEKSVTLEGTDENFNSLWQDGSITFSIQALDSTHIGDYNFQPFMWVQSQTSINCHGWGTELLPDFYDLNGNNNRSEVISTTTNQTHDSWLNNVFVTHLPDINFMPAATSRLTGEDNTVEFFSGDSGAYTLEILNELREDATNTVAYIPIPQKGNTLIDKDGKTYTQNWTPQLTGIINTLTSDPGFEPQGVETWYTTLSNPTKNELCGGTDSGYVKYTGENLPSNVTMVKLKIAQLPKGASVKLNLTIKAAECSRLDRVAVIYGK